MTSSIRDGIQQDHNKQAYKPFNPMEEPGLISILFLSRGRHGITKQTLATTFEAAALYPGEVEWLFLEQGHGGEAAANLTVFRNLPVERKLVVESNRNYGINVGLNTLWGMSRGSYCMILENDWQNAIPTFDFLTAGKSILDERQSVGVVQLRAIFDPAENWGRNKPEYNPWSCSPAALEEAGIKIWQDKTVDGHEFYISEFPAAFNNNPILIRKSLYKECGVYPEPPMTHDPRHGETEYQGRVARTGCAAAHIGKEVYYHIGGSRSKEFSNGT
jgi:GT2 family glycosyltransferase